MLYTRRFFFSSKCSLFHNANLFGFCIIHILYTGVLKFKKNNSGAKGLIIEKLIGLRLLGFNTLLSQPWTPTIRRNKLHPSWFTAFLSVTVQSERHLKQLVTCSVPESKMYWTSGNTVHQRNNT